MPPGTGTTSIVAAASRYCRRWAEGQHAQHRHLETGARTRRQIQIATAVERHLVPQLHHFRPQLRGIGGRVDAIADECHRRHQLLHLDAVQGLGQRLQHAAPVGRELGQRGDHLHQARAIAVGQRLQHRADLGAIDRAEHGAHHVLAQRAAGIGNGLVEQRQTVAQRAVGGLGQLHDRRWIRFDLLGGQDPGHLALDLVFVQPLEIELQAARQHGHRQLLRVGGGQQELHVLGRLFQRLQQRIERGLGEHVHFVDQIDLELAARGHVLGVLDYLAHIVHAGVGRGVDFQQVDIAAGVDIQAGRALAARIGTGAGLAIQRFGENARNRGLAHAAGAGEQKCVVHTPTVERVTERADHVFLAYEFGKTLRAPLAGENKIRHRATSFL